MNQNSSKSHQVFDSNKFIKLIQEYHQSGNFYSSQDSFFILQVLLDEHKSGLDTLLQEHYPIIQPSLLSHYIELTKDYHFQDIYDQFIIKLYRQDINAALKHFKGSIWYYPNLR